MSIYHERASEREYFPEYLQRATRTGNGLNKIMRTGNGFNRIVRTGNGCNKGLGLGSRKGKYCLKQLEHAFG